MKRLLTVAFCVAATINAGGAFAQPPQPLDILGVQLGMPREAAVHLLLSHKPPYSVTNTNGLNVENLGPSVWHTSLASNKPDVVDSIDLDFAPPPTASKVLRIYRNACFNCFGDNSKTSPDAPSLENFIRSLAEKLKSTTPTAVIGRSRNAGTPDFETSVYVWTPAGEFLSSAELSRRLRYPARCTNPPKLDDTRTNVGVDFNLHIDDQNFANVCGTVATISWQQVGGIITHYEMTITDVAGLLSAFAKSTAVINAKMGSQHQQELQRANQNRPSL